MTTSLGKCLVIYFYKKLLITHQRNLINQIPTKALTLDTPLPDTP